MKREIEGWLETAFKVGERLFESVGYIALFLTGVLQFLGLGLGALLLVAAVALGAHKMVFGDGPVFGLGLIYLGISLCAVSFALHKWIGSLYRARLEGRRERISGAYLLVRDLIGIVGGLVLLSGLAVNGIG